MNGRLVVREPVGTRDYTDPFGPGTPRTYDHARCTSPLVLPGFGVTELIGSWNANTPGGSWVEIAVRGTADDGRLSKRYVLGRWAEEDTPAPHLGGQPA